MYFVPGIIYYFGIYFEVYGTRYRLPLLYLSHHMVGTWHQRLTLDQSSENREVPVGVRPETGGRWCWPIT